MANVQIPGKTFSPIEPSSLHEAWYNYGKGTNKLNFPVGCFLFPVSSGNQMVWGGYSTTSLLETPQQAVQASLSGTLIVKAGVITISTLGKNKGSNTEWSVANQLLPVTKQINEISIQRIPCYCGSHTYSI